MYRSNHRKREGGGTSVVCLIPNFTFCAHKFLYMGSGASCPPAGHIHLPCTYEASQDSSGSSGCVGPRTAWCISVRMTEEVQNRKGGSRSAEAGGRVFLSFPFPGCKTFITYYIATLILSIHSSGKRRGFLLYIQYIHTLPNNLNLSGVTVYIFLHAWNLLHPFSFAQLR